MYRSKIGKLTLFILPFCLSAGVGREVAAKESGTIQITGKVLSLRGEPMEGVAVRLVLPSRVGLEKEIGLTDAEGAFEGEVKLKEIGKKRFTLKAAASGYAEANEPVPVLLPATSMVVNLFLRELEDASEQPRLEALEKLVMNRLGRSASHRKVSSEARAEFKKGMRIWRQSDQPGEAEVHFARRRADSPFCRGNRFGGSCINAHGRLDRGRAHPARSDRRRPGARRGLPREGGMGKLPPPPGAGRGNPGPHGQDATPRELAQKPGVGPRLSHEGGMGTGGSPP